MSFKVCNVLSQSILMSPLLTKGAFIVMVNNICQRMLRIIIYEKRFLYRLRKNWNMNNNLKKGIHFKWRMSTGKVFDGSAWDTGIWIHKFKVIACEIQYTIVHTVVNRHVQMSVAGKNVKVDFMQRIWNKTGRGWWKNTCSVWQRINTQQSSWKHIM